MNQNTIYTITTIREAIGPHSSRCVGFFHDLEDAISSVEDNIGDINEDGYYLYCVIERVIPGIYSFESDSAYWFRWNGIHGYQKCSKPDNYKRGCCFGIG